MYTHNSIGMFSIIETTWDMNSEHPEVQWHRRCAFRFRNRKTAFLTADMYLVYGLFNEDIRT